MEWEKVDLINLDEFMITPGVLLADYFVFLSRVN